MIRVFVGCSPNGEDAESLAVLEYTLRKHSSQPVELNFMKLSKDPSNFWYSDPTNEKNPGWNTSLWATPFSGFRWGIPEYCNFQGRAIYMDSDMIINNDIAKLWNQIFQPGKFIMSKGGNEGWRFCVALWDNERAKSFLPPLSRRKGFADFHRNMMYNISNSLYVQQFEGDWNNVDGEGKDFKDIDILHYSSMNHQFHLKHALPRLNAAGQKHWFDGQVQEHPRKDLQQIFDNLLHEAVDHGYAPEKYIPNDQFGKINKESQADYNGGNQWVR